MSASVLAVSATTASFRLRRIDALLKFVFVFEPGVKPLQVRAVPQRIRLFADRNATRYPVLDQQGISDQLQNPPAVPSGPPMICQFLGKWLDDLEHFGHIALVMRQHDALGQHVGDDQEPFR